MSPTRRFRAAAPQRGIAEAGKEGRPVGGCNPSDSLVVVAEAADGLVRKQQGNLWKAQFFPSVAHHQGHMGAVGDPGGYLGPASGDYRPVFVGDIGIVPAAIDDAIIAPGGFEAAVEFYDTRGELRPGHIPDRTNDDEPVTLVDKGVEAITWCHGAQA